MSQVQKKKKEPKAKKTKSELSEIAQRAVAKRKENHPEWGQMKRDKDTAKKLKAELNPAS